MAVFKLARFEIRPGTGDAAERAMRAYADAVRRDLPDSSWTVYRDPTAPTRFVAMIRADDAAADQRHREAPCTVTFDATLAPLLAGAVELTACELVTSSDLQRRLRPGAARGRRPR